MHLHMTEYYHTTLIQNVWEYVLYQDNNIGNLISQDMRKPNLLYEILFLLDSYSSRLDETELIGYSN